MSSWGESLNDYVREKSGSAPPLPQIERFGKRSGAAKKLEGRDFNIVSNVDSLGSTLPPDHAERSRRHVERGITRALASASHGYDLLSMRPKFGMSEEAVAHVGNDRGHRGKRIDIRMSASAGVSAALASPPRGESAEAGPPSPPRRPPRRPPRQTNIINHRYLENHEERTKEDQERARNRVCAIAVSTNGFDPLSGKYRLTETEEAAVAAKEAQDEAVRERVANHTYRVSGIVARSEGHAYDIVTQHIYNADYVLKVEQNNCKGIPQRAELAQSWMHRRDLEEAVRDADVARALHRVAPERVLAEVRRGHDILSNQPFGLTVAEERAAGSPAAAAETAHPPLPLAAVREESVLDRLARGARPRGWTTSEVFRAAGPRSTHERVFHNVGSSMSSAIATFEGRRNILLPTKEKLLAASDKGAAGGDVSSSANSSTSVLRQFQ